MNYYIYYKEGNHWFYERTVGTLNAAKQRIEELKKLHPLATEFKYTTTIIKDAFY